MCIAYGSLAMNYEFALIIITLFEYTKMIKE